ncbi:MAG: 2OG-Fe(II) oxygenase, partial [Myxococcota bacterium]
LQTAMLLEGPTANLIRQASRHGRTRSQMPSPTLPTGDSNDGPWALASALPSELFASAWREPERWRRLAEERRAGRTLLRLDGLFTTDAALELRKAAAALPFEERHTTYVRGAGCELEDHHLTSWRSALTHGPCNALLSAVMDEDLPERMFARVWKLGQGDGISVHKDGIHYVATLSIGLCPGWTASHGGAIAFGQPTAQGLDVVERWLPHLGDALLFRPTALAWHAVEPVEHGMRYTLTTHYVSPQYGAA